MIYEAVITLPSSGATICAVLVKQALLPLRWLSERLVPLTVYAASFMTGGVNGGVSGWSS